MPQPATQPGERGENVTVNASVQRLGPHHGFGSAVNLSGGGPLMLAFEGGEGRALLARMDLAENGTGNGTFAMLRHAGRLLGNVREGRGVLRGGALLEAGGPGVRFRLHDARFHVLREAHDAMGVPLPQETLAAFDSHWLHAQACAPPDADGPLPFALRVTHEAAAEGSESDGPRAVPPPPLAPLALAGAAALRRARRAG